MDEKKLEAALRNYCAAPELPEGFDTVWRSVVKQEEKLMMNENENRKKNFRSIWKILIPVAAAIVLVIGSLSASQFMPQKVTEQSTANTPTTNGFSAKRSASVNATEIVDESAEYEEVFLADTSAADSTSSGSGIWQNATQEKKIIRSAFLTLKTQEFDASLASINSLVEEMGGYLEYSYQSSNDNSGLRSATMTIRIPQEKLDEFLTRSGSLARVTEQSQSSTDVSTQYYDNETRLATLRAKMTRLTELLEQAETVEDLITIESAISETQYSIDSYETTQRSLDSSVTMSSVSLTLREEKEKEVAVSEKISFGERIAAAFKAGFAALGAFGQNMLVFLTLAAPFLLGAALIGLVVWLIIRGKRKAAQKKSKPND